MADQAKSSLEARVRELDEAAARDRASIGELESRLAAAAEQGRTPQAREESDPATDTTAARDDASTTVADASLKRPQAASGDQRLGEVEGSTIAIEWPEGAGVDVAWSATFSRASSSSTRSRNASRSPSVGVMSPSAGALGVGASLPMILTVAIAAHTVTTSATVHGSHGTA